jgi:hypothetical protein
MAVDDDAEARCPYSMEVMAVAAVWADHVALSTHFLSSRIEQAADGDGGR